MKCKEARLSMFEATAGAEFDEHLRQCPSCAAEAASLRATMALLDSWQAPEPSPYFDARLRAKLNAEHERSLTWREWLAAAFSPFTDLGRRTVLVASMALLIAGGVTLYRTSYLTPGAPQPTVAEQGTAVADLQQLDKNEDLYKDFDLLDEVAEGQQAQ